MCSSFNSYNFESARELLANIWKIGFNPVTALTIGLVPSLPMLHLAFLGTIGKHFTSSTLLESAFLLASLLTAVGTYVLPNINTPDILQLLVLEADH